MGESAWSILRNERGSYGRNDRRLGLAGGLGLVGRLARHVLSNTGEDNG